jgi:hypothetical protein
LHEQIRVQPVPKVCNMISDNDVTSSEAMLLSQVLKPHPTIIRLTFVILPVTAMSCSQVVLHLCPARRSALLLVFITPEPHALISKNTFTPVLLRLLGQGRAIPHSTMRWWQPTRINMTSAKLPVSSQLMNTVRKQSVQEILSACRNGGTLIPQCPGQRTKSSLCLGIQQNSKQEHS